MPEVCRITCGHCSETFPFDNSNNYLPRCPNCRKVSSINSKYARRRGIFYFVLGILSLCVGIGIATGTIGYSEVAGGLFTAYAWVLLSTVVLFGQSYHYFRLKGSVLGSDDPV